MIARFVTLVSLALVGVSAGSVLAPKLVARIYGVPLTDDAGRVYLRGMGVRDAALGLLLLYFQSNGNRAAASAVIGFCVVAGFGDLVLVSSARGVVPNLALHAGGVVALASLWTAARNQTS